MNKISSIKSRGSLLERAAATYDLDAAMRDNAPVVETPPAPPPTAAEAAAAPAPAAPAATQAGSPPRLQPRPRAFTGRHGTVAMEELREAGFILPDSPVNALNEEFRIIKRQLLLAATGRRGSEGLDHGRMILVCSAEPNEGKTFCAVNLALSMATEKDVDVLLVDADFAKPEVLSTLGLEGGPGLIDAIADPKIDVESCVIRTDIPNLSVLPAGRQSNEATELVASNRTGEVLDQLVSGHPDRIVIFDSPPALVASPASVLALHVGQILMVVKADQTTETQLRDAIGLLSGCPHLQLVINGVQFSANGRRFGDYYGAGS
ncbi:AAA family ATPase [Flavisphingomonas formosensis]|uniref:AAA family ATPase n=1 Tax=Flavisphingomonas formosensis TaxID=861534 RepID=UPI0012F85BA3|nr:AAA family ATPase [Sphingomonas formosensis]